MHNTPIQSPNFSFLRDHGEDLVEYAARAERYALDDPNTCLIKLRQLAEELAETAAAHTGVSLGYGDGFSDLLRELARKAVITPEMADIFHGLRRAGNAAAHEGGGTRQEALTQLKLARQLAIWFHQAFRDAHYRPGPFVMPPNPPAASATLKAELDRVRKARWDLERQAEATAFALKKAREQQENAEARAAKLYGDLEAALQLAEESEAREAALREAHAARLATVRANRAAANDGTRAAQVAQAQAAAHRFDLTEGEARERIDSQLRACGWEADSLVRTWENGARPQVGRNQAIAFCPAGDGVADYVLFCGLSARAVIEAKRCNHDLRAALNEARHHAQAFNTSELGTAHGPVARLFASNGRPYSDAADPMLGIWVDGVAPETMGPRCQAHWPAPDAVATA
jgi:type I restriction enzyme R subunit